MPQVNPKKEHRIYYPNFAGGMNLSVPPEALGKNELSDAVNVEYSMTTGAMTVRGGLRHLYNFNEFGEKIVEAVPFPEHDAAVVRVEKEIEITLDGRTERVKVYSYLLFDFKLMAIFNFTEGFTSTIYNEKYGAQVTPFGDNVYVMAMGDPSLIYEFSYDSANKMWSFLPILGYHLPVANSGANHSPFTRAGRVGVVSGDYLNFSAVGDHKDWDKNKTTDSDSKFIEIGYKDGLDISAVVPLSKDIVIFKKSQYNASEGKIYRLANNYPDWEVSEIASGVTTYTSKSVCVVGNDVYFLSPQGLQTLSTVQAYGDVKVNWPDQKINQQLISEITYNAQMWNIPSRQQLWISPSPSCKHIWIFDYVHMIWTKFEFPDYVSYVCELNGVVYVFIGNDVFTLDEDKVRDDTSADGRADIEAYMKCGKLTYGEQILVKGAYAEHSLINGYHSGELDLDAFSMPFTTQKTSSRRRCIVRGWSVTPEIKMKGGGTSISSMGLDTAEI